MNDFNKYALNVVTTFDFERKSVEFQRKGEEMHDTI